MPPTFEFESELQEAIVRALEACGCWPMVNRVVRHRGRPTGLGTGSPDLLVAIPTHGLVWLEIKLPGEKPSADQLRWHHRAQVFGQRVWVVRSVTESLAVVQAVRGGRATAFPAPAGSAAPLPPAPREGASGRSDGPPTRPTRPRGRQGAAIAKPDPSQTKTKRVA